MAKTLLSTRLAGEAIFPAHTEVTERAGVIAGRYSGCIV